MRTLREEIADFKAGKQVEAANARQLAALQLACHIDLSEAMSADPAARNRIVLRLERMIERERQKGMRRHWSYDLNRHIALKQALDRLGRPGVRPACKPRFFEIRRRAPIKQNGAPKAPSR